MTSSPQRHHAGFTPEVAAFRGGGRPSSHQMAPGQGSEAELTPGVEHE